jgi:hypothetical protein
MAKAQPIMIGDGADSSGDENSGEESILHVQEKTGQICLKKISTV